MLYMDSYKSVDLLRYDVYETQLINKVHMEDGTILEGIVNVGEITDVFEYLNPNTEYDNIDHFEMWY